MNDFSEDFEKYLNLYLDGYMDPDQERMFEQYLAENPDKAEEMRAYKTLDLKAKEEKLPDLADGYWDGLNARIDSRIAHLDENEAFEKGFWRRLGDFLFSPGKRMKFAAGVLSVLAVALISRHFINTLSITKDAAQPIMKTAKPIVPKDERDTVLELHEEIPVVQPEPSKSDGEDKIKSQVMETIKQKIEKTEITRSTVDRPLAGNESAKSDTSASPSADKEGLALDAIETAKVEKPKKRSMERKKFSDTSQTEDTSALTHQKTVVEHIRMADIPSEKMSEKAETVADSGFHVALGGAEPHERQPDNIKLDVLESIRIKGVTDESKLSARTQGAPIPGDKKDSIANEMLPGVPGAKSRTTNSDSVRYGEEEMDSSLYESEALTGNGELFANEGKGFPDLRNEVFAKIKGLDEKEIETVSHKTRALSSGKLNRMEDDLEIASMSAPVPDIDSLRQSLNDLLNDYELEKTSDAKANLLLKMIDINLRLARATKDQYDIENGQELIRIASSIGIMNFSDFEAYSDSLRGINNSGK